MPRINEIKTLKYFSNKAIPSLRSYFGRVQSGQPNVYDTPFARGESTEDLLNNWEAVLVSIENDWPTLYEFEMDLAKKVGPLSVMQPLSARMDDVESYYSGIELPAEPISHSAVAAVLKEWSKIRGLQVRKQMQTVELMKKSTNSGSPFFTKRRNVVDDTVPCFIHSWNNTQHLNYVSPKVSPHQRQYIPLGRAYDMCAVLGWRGQEGGPSKSDVKQRVVWMFPFAANIMELMVYQPLIEAAQKFNLNPAWVSMESVDRSITKLFDTKDTGDLIVCTDFTKFDQHFNQMMQDCARDLLRGIFTNGRSFREWDDNVFDVKYNIPLMIDLGRLKTGHHGMGSGSGGTNADESLAHRALQYEVAQIHDAYLNPNSLCLGDDGILSYPGITVEDVVEAYTSHGLEMNTDKQYASSQDCVYLRRWHHENYRINGVCAGVYSTMRALGRLRYLERYYDPDAWGPKMVALRQLSIIENVKNHPLRDQFAEFCMKRDKYRLGIDIPGFLDNLEREAQQSIDYMPDFLGYTKTLQNEGQGVTGIDSWWIVKYLKSKR